MENNETKLLWKGLFILLFCITIIFCDCTYKVLLNSSSTVNNLVINEVVNFKEFNSDRITPFEIKKAGKLDIAAKANVQGGTVSIFVMSPEDKTIYKISGQMFEEDKVIDVYKGIWYYRVLCDNANNGSYSIAGELK